MRTIASTVAAYIKTKPYLSSALSDGIINLTSLARKIQPDIENVMRKTVNRGAIVMSLKRASDDAEFSTDSDKIIGVLKNMGDITVRSSLIDYSFSISETLLLNQAHLLKEIEHKKEVFYTSSRGVAESNIIVSQNISELVDTIFNAETCHSKVENLSSITIKLPTENVTIPGIYYFIFQRLSWEGINVNEIISTSNEFTILIDEQQVSSAFEEIKKLKSL
ncbi:aspartate kinase [Flavobacteriaceae bacterium]|nr:aspartate kinase [Flavobacteriaceae bacterium]